MSRLFRGLTLLALLVPALAICQPYYQSTGGTITAGGAVNGGGANRVLYEDGTQKLATAASFTFNGTALTAVLTGGTGLPISTGVSGLGTGIATALAVNTGSAGAPMLFNGAGGTPSSIVLTNASGTASININGTVGATTPTTVAATTVTGTGVSGTSPTFNFVGDLTTGIARQAAGAVSVVSAGSERARFTSSFLFLTGAQILLGGSGDLSLNRTGLSTLSIGNNSGGAGGTIEVLGITRNSAGTDKTIGNATLVGGTVTVSTTSALAGSFVHLTRKTAGGTIGTSFTYTISAGVSFTITSDNVLDTSVVTWQIFN